MEGQEGYLTSAIGRDIWQMRDVEITPRTDKLRVRSILTRDGTWLWKRAVKAPLFGCGGASLLDLISTSTTTFALQRFMDDDELLHISSPHPKT